MLKNHLKTKKALVGFIRKCLIYAFLCMFANLCMSACKADALNQLS